MPDFNPANIPAELKGLDQWVLWKAEPRGERISKVPYRLDGRRASSTCQDDWAGFDRACQKYASGQGQYSGVGFVFREGGGVTGIDLDHVITGGVIDPLAARAVEAFGSYVEYSVSGQGLHIIGKGIIPDGHGHRREPFEVYDRSRYFTVSGRPYGEPRPLRDCQPQIDRLLDWMKRNSPQPAQKVTQTPRVSVCPDDSRLLHKAASARNGYKFARLWRGDTSDYGGDDSRADLALLALLMFWTRGDEARADALFRQSGLCRDKWTSRVDYRERCFNHLR